MDIEINFNEDDSLDFDPPMLMSDNIRFSFMNSPSSSNKLPTNIKKDNNK